MPSKKGFVHKSMALIAALDVSWFWTWSAAPPPDAPPGLDFVPCKWSAGARSAIAGRWPVVLGFNEPDCERQANVDARAAAASWQQLVARHGARVGSPQTARNPLAPGSWLRQFLQHGGSFDILCVHRYAGPDAGKFLRWLDELFAEFQRPIWVTEFAVARWRGGGGPHGLESVKQFMREACAGMDARPHVERYCWKTRGTDCGVMGTSALAHGDGSLTELGLLYKAL